MSKALWSCRMHELESRIMELEMDGGDEAAIVLRQTVVSEKDGSRRHRFSRDFMAGLMAIVSKYNESVGDIADKFYAMVSLATGLSVEDARIAMPLPATSQMGQYRRAYGTALSNNLGRVAECANQVSLEIDGTGIHRQNWEKLYMNISCSENEDIRYAYILVISPAPATLCCLLGLRS